MNTISLQQCTRALHAIAYALEVYGYNVSYEDMPWSTFDRERIQVPHYEFEHGGYEMSVIVMDLNEDEFCIEAYTRFGAKDTLRQYPSSGRKKDLVEFVDELDRFFKDELFMELA